jgi:glycosyltransferase involved in cell wall biosynthesis
MDSLTRGLLDMGHQVKVVSIHTDKHPFLPDQIELDYLAQTQLEVAYADTELNVRDALSHLVTGESYHLSRFLVPEMERTVEDALRAQVYDVVLLESLFTTAYIPAIRRLSDADLVLRAHNVEHALWDEVAADMTSRPKRWLLNRFKSKLESEEVKVLAALDGVVTITRDDAAWFEVTLQNVHPTSKCRVEVVPFGMDVDGTPHAAMNEAPTRALHLGAMDWAPNHQGVSWFVQDVWPLVRQALPEAQVALAGRNMGPEWTSDENAGVHVLGEVDDAAATYDTPSVVVVPLHAGSGMRIKIAEALAAGRPIVTTTKGMTGLPLEHEEHVMVADTPEHFAKALVELLSNGDKATAMGQRGRAWAQVNLQHRARAERLTAFLEELVAS